MNLTKVLPLGMTSYWFNDAFSVNAVLLRDTVTSVPDTAQAYFQIQTLEIAAAGGYPAGGILMPTIQRVENATAGVAEWDTGSSLWTSSGTGSYTVSGFRWIALCHHQYHVILALHDLGGTQSFSGTNLSLAVTESTYSPGVFPILRMRRNLT